MESTFIILFSIASLVAIAVRRTTVPYTVALVVVALVAGAFHWVDAPHLTKELLFALFLPGLVFEAAYNIHVRELRESWRSIAILAVVGVVVAIIVTAGIMIGGFKILGIATGLDWKYGLVFAALVAATDPIAVVGLFRRLGVSPRLTTLIEAESLFNDGTSIVILSLVLAYVGGTSSGIATLTLEFVTTVGGGALIGSAVSFFIARVTKQLDEPMIEIALTTIAAYGSFVIAERLHFSGVIATVCAGLVLGTYGREVAMSAATRVSVDTFWEYIAFALNSIVFLLIGFTVDIGGLIASAAPIIVAFVAIAAARAGIIYATMLALWRTSERFTPKWAAAMTWGGLRGALSMVLALALPVEFPHRALLIDMTLGVVVLSLVLQGLTMQLLVNRLGVVDLHGTTSPAQADSADGGRPASLGSTPQ
jgi:CPA1 family monovalent cation:H+ antiporter